MNGIRAQIQKEVFEEITNPEFLSRTHGRPSTYNTGCRGPLCRKAQREAQRKRDATSRERQGLPPRKPYSSHLARTHDELLKQIFNTLYNQNPQTSNLAC